MIHELHRWRRLVAGCVLAVALGVLSFQPYAVPAAAAAPPIKGSAVTATSLAPGFGGFLHRLITRTERTSDRAVSFLAQMGALGLWVTVSLAAFLLVTAFSSVADLRMWDVRQQGVGALVHYIGHGMWTFFRILVDRHTPYSARSVFVAALVYWLVPLDLIDDSSLPGFVDDLFIAVVAAKGFMYFCPDTLVAAHAAAVEGQA